MEKELSGLRREERQRLLDARWPRVRFTRTTRAGRDEKIVLPVRFERRIYRRGTCYRWQCPLRLSWAITIHKSQGMSLSNVVCDVGGAFAAGQIYVALSRATRVEGLQIVNFDPGRIQASYTALHFHTAASDTSARRTTGPLAAYWAKAHFWWLPLINTPNADPRWLSMYESKIEAWQLRRWRLTYPVPPNLLSPTLAAQARV